MIQAKTLGEIIGSHYEIWREHTIIYMWFVLGVRNSVAVKPGR